MNTIKSLRLRLHLTQQQLAEKVGCTQGNINLYEHGQGFPVEKAHKLISYARSVGVVITLDDVYPMPKEKQIAA